MAIVKSGRLTGKVGNTVYYMRNGIQYARALPKSTKHEPSPAQRAQRLRMKLVMKFVSPLAPMLNNTFRPGNRKLSGVNKAVRHALRAEAVEGVFPDLYLQPEKVLVSSGILPTMRRPQLVLDGVGNATLTWYRTSVIDDDDLAFMLLYNVNNGRGQLAGGDTYRTQERLTVKLNEEILRGTTHAYGFMMDRLRRSASDSVFLGTLVDGVLEGPKGGTP